MIFKTTFSIGMDDVDRSLNCRDNVILKYLENAACFHADALGQGLNNVENNKCAWALLEWEVEILKRPVYGNKVDVDTWSRLATKSFAYRDYILYADGVPAVHASSKWFRLDLERRRPVRITDEVMEAYGAENKSILGITDIEKIYEQESYSETAEYDVRKSDIDILGHVHNTHYIDIAYEMLSDQEIQNLSHIRISYKKEVALGEKMIIKKNVIDNKIYFALTTGGGEVVNALIELSLTKSFSDLLADHIGVVEE